MRIITLIAMLLTLLLLPACGSDPDSEWNPCCREEPPMPFTERVAESANLQYALSVAQARRAEIIKPDFDEYAAALQAREAREINMERFNNRPRAGETITREQALNDANELFEIIRYVYGAYIYFGGDEVFSPIFAEITETINSHGTWYVAEFEQLLFNRLDQIINDNHFMLGERFMGNTYNFFTSDGIAFDLTENGFVCRNSGLYVSSVLFMGETFIANEVFQLSMCENGSIFYSIVISIAGETITEPTYSSAVINYENGESETIALHAVYGTRREFAPPSLECLNGIPVVTVKQMEFPESTYRSNAPAYARRFLAYAELLRDEPVIIVDIRSNGGGYSNLPIMWLHLLLGEIVPSNHFGIEALNYDDWIASVQGQRRRNRFYGSYEHFRTYSSPVQIGNYHSAFRTEPRRIVQNDQLLILLTDRFTGSAAEAFTDLAFNLQNALVIGQNTAGVLITNMTFPRRYLQNSGIPFGLGRGIHVHPQNHLPEGIGITPDIWVNGCALEAALALVGNFQATFQ